MKLERALGILILSEFLLEILATISNFSLEPFLPASLRDYLVADKAATSQLYYTILWALWITVVVTTVLAWIGLLNLARPARTLYLASWAGYFVLLLLRGPVATASVSFVLEMMTAIVGGAILAMIYFSELAAKFRPLSELVGAEEEKAA
jgi:hypothetical protein